MKLPKIFHSAERKFRDALEAQDFSEVSRQLEAGYSPQGKSFIAFAKTACVGNLEVFFRNSSWDFAPLSVVNFCLEENNPERVDMLLGMGFDFNFDFYQNHPLRQVFTCDVDKQKKLQWLEKMTAGGINQIRNKEQFLFDAVTHNFPEAVELALRCGIDPHAGTEWPLRLAAKNENREMCLTLIKHGADLPMAQIAADANWEKETQVAIFLAKLEDELKPREKPATIETMSEEMKKLRDMVAELTQKVEQLQSPVVRLDKPAQKMQP